MGGGEGSISKEILKQDCCPIRVGNNERGRDRERKREREKERERERARIKGITRQY